jgi:hypothetical protein
MRMDQLGASRGEVAAGRVEFDEPYADAITEDARAAAELATLRREFPRFTIERCQPVLGREAYYSATRRSGEWGVHPYHVSRSDLGELRRELTAGQGPGRG